jgi:hypothetical protein
MMNRATKFLAAGACAGMLALSGVAAAAAIQVGDQVEVQNLAGTVFTPSPDSNGLFSNVTIRVGSTNTTVSAGVFVLDYQITGSSDWEQFLSFCLSPDVWLQPFNNPYTAVGLSTYSASAALISEFWGRYRTSVTNDATAAAFQIGLWELASDSGRDLQAGSFQLINSEAIRGTAQSWLTSLNGTGPHASGLLVLVDRGSGTNVQDLIVQQVPEPGSLGLLGAGLAGLFLVRRRMSASNR